MRILLATPVVGANLPGWQEYAAGLGLPASVTVECWGPAEGPRAIETLYDEAKATHYLVRGALARCRRGPAVHAVVINCFADPGLHPLRELLDLPVVGAGEAAWLLACSLGWRIGHISILNNSVPHAYMRVAQMGIAHRLAASIPVPMGVLELEAAPERTVAAIVACAREAIDHHAADVIVLGCTGMYPYVNAVRKQVAAPVVEPTEAALWLAVTQAHIGFRYCRRWLYMPAHPLDEPQ
ncbi:MAG: aspartate/glutamate racemase family protein [Bacillota bacterium]